MRKEYEGEDFKITIEDTEEVKKVSENKKNYTYYLHVDFRTKFKTYTSSKDLKMNEVIEEVINEHMRKNP